MRKPRTPTLAQQRALARRLGAALQRDVPLAARTSFRIGGPAALYVEARTAEALATAVRAARELDIDYFLLGRGANILIGDRGFAGLVIANQARTITARGTCITADSGVLVYPDLIDAAVARGLSGLEHYVGIPSTVGGALWQNLHFLSPAPARERTMFIGEVLESAELLTADNQRRRVDVDYFEFGYDQSVLHARDDVVLSATFELEPAPAATLTRIMEENLRWRAERHPPLDSEPSAGSIFRKIEGIGAGRLIDECGLKGLACGDAQISPRHANIIVNHGAARAADVCALIMHVQQRVQRETGYWLTPEISFVGEFAPVTRLPTDTAAPTASAPVR
ncbi:UDP-N-acetylmuramate dehydrogenase [Salinisphaera sp. T31B1]|uniref:UDP-N-acetylmuramate dehydrogenase n=1 Tax=Salinisphaera sp. T31B1 TaxID=727963 RepID=UPI0033421BA8